MNEIWAVILAAGKSERMGSPKMLLPFGNKTMLACVIGNVVNSDTDRTMVVLGAENEKITEVVNESGVDYCNNQNFNQGMLSSVKCGLQNIPDDFRAALIFPGDQPLIRSSTVNLLIERYFASSKGIIIPLYSRKRGHPLLIDRKYREEIIKLDISQSLRSLSEKFPDDVLEIETDDEGILKDFDTPEEYRFEINKK
jgi:molybdenum cofactor cytidylyltransferase